MSKNVLIVGGGIGGLTAALCLARSGHQVTVFERSSKVQDIGAGIQCGANAVRVLDHLGLRHQIEQVSVKPREIVFRDYLYGSPLYQVELGKKYEDKYGAPYFHIHRADLYAMLYEAAGAHSSVDVLTDSDVRDFEETSDQVRVILSSGETFQGDLLIASDGIRSTIRKQIHSDKSAVYTGNVAWRATVATNKLPADFMPTVTTNFVGPRKHMVLYYLRAGELLNMVGVVEKQSHAGDSWKSKGDVRELQKDFSGWHPMVETVIDSVERDQCYQWALYDHRPINKWGTDRVVLLGDAAHATLPFIASGAAMAIEDARILDRCLTECNSVKTAIKKYQFNRFDRTSKVQNISRKFGKLYHIPNRLLLKTAFAGLRALGGKKEDFLPEYDANTIPLK
ncbi:MAG: FAD-dependent oxidoreductase [Gammaproteobacteria bacterium]|nr:FAD-dependent oxidoreductase [Gammaproteobacteria bacterium]